MPRRAHGQFSVRQGGDVVLSSYDAVSCAGVAANAYIRSVRELVRKNAQFFLLAGLAGLGLRLLFALRFPAVVDDSRFYADIAKNWLQHGIYGITDSGQIVPTLSRLPGYPAFLAVMFAIFGADNFRSVLLVQVLFDLATCLLIADLARRMLSERAAKTAFPLAAACPFLANYAAAALTETLEIFFTVLALDLAVCGLGANQSQDDVGSSASRSALWLGCGFSIASGILLRPDGGILLVAVGGYLLLLFFRELRQRSGQRRVGGGPLVILQAGVLVAVAALLPLVPWTLRNLRTMHRFEPLAPRYANDSDEPVMPGFNRWVKTWMADYVSVQEIYWPVPGADLDISRLPNRAFDSQQQRGETEKLLADYNEDHEVSRELDGRLAALAAARIRAAPLRYYVWLPAVRIVDMWLRPRTELLPSDPRWWEFNDDTRWLAVSMGFGLINLVYVAMALVGWLRVGTVGGFGLLVLFVVIRSLFLGSLENPEPRYTLECYPVVIVFVAALFSRVDKLPKVGHRM